MGDPNPIPTYDQDQEHLRLLVLFHKILAGIYAVFSLCGMPHFFIGLVATINPSSFSKDSPPDLLFGPMFMFMGGFLILFAWTLAVLNFLASRRIESRTGINLVYVISGLNCLWMPLGTALGVFTFIVVTRPSVRSVFKP